MRFTLDSAVYSSDDEDSTSSIEDVESNRSSYDSTDSEEEEEPHPLGFGRTRYGINFVSIHDLPSEQPNNGDESFFVEDTTSTSLDFEDKAKLENRAAMTLMKMHLSNESSYHRQRNEYECMRIQSFPPVYSSGRVSQRTANAATVMHHTLHIQNANEEKDDRNPGVNDSENQEGRIQHLLNAAFSGMSINDNFTNKSLPSNDSQQINDFSSELQKIRDHEAECLLALQREVLFSSQELEKKRKKMQLEMDKDHMEAVESLRLLLEQDKRDAEKYLLEQEKEEKKEAEYIARQKKEREKEKEEEKRRELEKEQLQQKQQQQLQNDAQKVIDIKAHPPSTETKKSPEKAISPVKKKQEQPEYLQKGLRSIMKLVDFRESLSVFDKSKAVSRRRLQMKKVVKGKLNTLNHSKEKVTSIANEIYTAVKTAREEDQTAKKDGQGPPETSKGYKYLLDLIASNMIVRIQAEGFNGVKGDGFPLANAIVILSSQIKDLAPIISAHLFTACPTLIPSIPKSNVKEMSEEEFMKSLGMAKQKNGDFETFGRFLSRTEGIISVAAGMMCSRPSAHTLLGGNAGALDFLKHFLEQLDLSENMSTLPLITGPVLGAFLTTAGHMLARKFPDDFQQLLNTIRKKVCPNLDTGEFGAPSAVRLTKLTTKGFEWFQNTLPEGAISGLYSGGAQVQQSVPSTSASFVVGSTEPNHQTGSSNGVSNTHGFANTLNNEQSGPGASIFQQNPSTSTFQLNESSSNIQSNQSTSSFQTNQNTTSFQSNQTTSSFQPNQNTSNFQPNQGNQQSQPVFGGFGMQAQNDQPFGGFGGQTQNSNASNSFTSFGNNPIENNQKAEKSKYKPLCRYFAQGKCRYGKDCKFSHSTTSSEPQKSSFGASKNSPFGTNTQNQNTPFGSSNQRHNMPFGASSQTQNSPFGAPSQTQATPFGVSSQNQNSPFGPPMTNQNNNPFGQTSTGGNPFQKRF